MAFSTSVIGFAILAFVTVCCFTSIDWRARRAESTAGDLATVARIRSYHRVVLFITLLACPLSVLVLWNLTEGGREWWYLLPSPLFAYAAFRLSRVVSRMRIVSGPQLTDDTIVFSGQAAPVALDVVCDIVEMDDQLLLGRGLRHLSSFEPSPALMVHLREPTDGVWRYLAVGEQVPDFIEGIRSTGFEVTRIPEL